MLASADIYVSAMADETFGLSVLEAQASGLPVVGFASGAMVQRVPPALGRLVSLDDTDAMAQAVVDVWQGEHAAIGQRAREHVTSRFSWRQTFETLLGDVYPQALARSAARSEARNMTRWRNGHPARQGGRYGG
jgi:alpha-1,6-mannosyltransferase